KKPFTVFEVIDFPDSGGAFSTEKRQEFEKNFADLPLDKFIVKKAHNWAGSVSVDGGMYTSDFVPCTFLWHTLVIISYGEVGPCPQDFMGEIILGDVSKQTLREIFNGPELVRLRQQMIEGQLEKWLPCNGCDVIRRKKLMGLPIPSFKYLKE